jgi:hypothetical protein
LKNGNAGLQVKRKLTVKDISTNKHNVHNVKGRRGEERRGEESFVVLPSFTYSQ